MNKLITILAALLVVIVGNYSFAQDENTDVPVKITTPKPSKAQNGANDPAVKAESEKEKQKEEKDASRITEKDFTSYSEKTNDDQVVQFRRGNELITMIPFRSLWLSPERKEAFEMAQLYGEKLAVTWLRRAFNVRHPTTAEMMQAEVNSWSAAQLRENLKAHNRSQPTPGELLSASQDAAEAMKRLKADKKFLIEFDDLIAAYDSHQAEIVQATGLKVNLKKAAPSAVLLIGSYKVPAAVIERMKQSKLLVVPAFLLSGHINFSVAVRPWKVVIQNLDTGVVTQDYHFEGTPQAWFMKDTASDRFESPQLRIGAGVILGDYNRDVELNGITAGVSLLTRDNIRLGGILPIPANLNFRAGVITSTKTVKNAYLTLTRQFGMAAPLANVVTLEGGGVFSLSSVTDSVKFSSKSLEEWIKLIEEQEPGTTVTITKAESSLNGMTTPNATPVEQPKKP